MNWSNVYTIGKRQFRSYFNGPVAAIVVSVVLLFVGFFFWSRFFLINRASMREMFEYYGWALCFACPAITMGLLAEEKRSNTIELLITMPVREAEVIFGKFFAAVALLKILVLASLPFAFTVSTLGQLDWGPVLTGYIGLLLEGAAMLGIGTLLSSMTDNQLVAFFVSLFVNFVLVFIFYLLPFIPTALLAIFEQISFGYHLANFSRGVLDTRDFLYFITVTVFALMAAFRSLESRRWS